MVLEGDKKTIKNAGGTTEVALSGTTHLIDAANLLQTPQEHSDKVTFLNDGSTSKL